MIVDKTYPVKIMGTNKPYYQKRGYDVPKSGETLDVSVFDLPIKTGRKIEVICDNCGKHVFQPGYCHLRHKYHHCGEEPCKNIIERKRYFEKTGFETPQQNPAIREKIAKTNFDRYKAENVYASDYGKQKIKEVRDAKHQKMIEENSIPLKEYIYKKIGGELNYEFITKDKKVRMLDIAFLKDKIYVMVCDGSYFRFFKRGFVWDDIKTAEIGFESDLSNEGWKIIRIIYMNEQKNDNRSKIFSKFQSGFEKAYKLCLSDENKVVISIDSQNIYYQNKKEDFWYDSK